MQIRTMQIGSSGTNGLKSIALCSAVLLLAYTPIRAVGTEHSEVTEFVDEVLVKEVGIIVNSQGVMPKRAEALMKANEFSVLEDRSQRVVTKLIPIADLLRRPKGEASDSEEAGPWNIVIYFDRELSLPSPAVASLVGLAQRTDELKELGSVSIAVADPSPRVVLSRSQTPRRVAKILLDLAEVEREERDSDPLRLDFPISGKLQPPAEVVRRQWDRLVTLLCDASYDGPRALVLVADGFSLSAADLKVLSGRRDPTTEDGASPELAQVVMDTARALSSYGWLTIPVSLGQPRPEPREPAADPFNESRDLAEGRVLSGDQRTIVNFFGTTKRGGRTAALDDRLFEAYSLPQLAPLRALSEATAGTLAWYDDQLDNAIKELGEHWWLWYQTPDPHDGRIRRIEVMHEGTSKHFRSPWWMRSSTPRFVSEARLRLLLGGDQLDDNRLPLAVDVVSETPGTNDTNLRVVLRLRISDLTLADAVSVGHFRFSVAQESATSDPVIQHVVDFEAPALGRDWEYVLPIEVESNLVSLAVSVEDLSRETWGAVVLDPNDLSDQ